MKPYRVAFSHLADVDLDQILDHIAEDNPIRALTFIDELREYARDTIGLAPKGGSYIPEIGAWFKPYKQYIFVYDIDDGANLVIIHMVSHSARQWRSIFSGRF